MSMRITSITTMETGIIIIMEEMIPVVEIVVGEEEILVVVEIAVGVGGAIEFKCWILTIKASTKQK